MTPGALLAELRNVRRSVPERERARLEGASLVSALSSLCPLSLASLCSLYLLSLSAAWFAS